MICRCEMVISDGFEMMRQPIPENSNQDVKLKNAELKGKLGERNMKMISDMEAAMDRLAESDPMAKYGITEAVAERVRDHRTGKWIDAK